MYTISLFTVSLMDKAVLSALQCRISIFEWFILPKLHNHKDSKYLHTLIITFSFIDRGAVYKGVHKSHFRINALAYLKWRHSVDTFLLIYKIIVSSAWSNECKSPNISLDLHFSFKVCIKSSIKKMNKFTLEVAPWRMPELVWNFSEYWPFRYTMIDR